MRTSILKSNEATSLRTNVSTAVPFRCRLIAILCAGVQISLPCRQLQEMVEFTCYGFIFTPHKFRNCTRLLWIHVCRHADNAESKCVQHEPGFATMRFIASNAMLVSGKHRNCILCPSVHSCCPLNIVVGSPVVHSLLVTLGDVFCVRLVVGVLSSHEGPRFLQKRQA